MPALRMWSVADVDSLPVGSRAGWRTQGLAHPGALFKIFEMAFITGVSLPPTSSRLALQPERCMVELNQPATLKNAACTGMTHAVQ